MHAAVQKLNQIRKEDHLDIALHLNSEPTFSQAENDPNHYVYSGTIGKIMPSVLCYGKETHVGQPLNGISSNSYKVLLIAKWNTVLCLRKHTKMKRRRFQFLS